MAQTWILCISALWPWPWKYDLESRSWHTLGSWTTIVWNIIQIQHGSEELWPGHRLWVCVHCDLNLGGMTLGQEYDTPSVMDKNYVKYYPDLTWQRGVISWTRILSMCALWPWPRRYKLGSWHILGPCTIIVWNIIQIGQGLRSYGSDTMRTDGQTNGWTDPRIIMQRKLWTLKICWQRDRLTDIVNPEFYF